MADIRNFLTWRKERFSIGVYLALALCLSLPAFGMNAFGGTAWTLSLLLQVRLLDDLQSCSRDRVLSPERFLCGLPSLGGMKIIVLALVLVNLIPLFAHDSLVYLLYIGFLLLQLKTFHPSFKYGALAAIIDQFAGIGVVGMLIHAVLVCVAASAYELGHDAFESRSQALLYAVLVLAPLGLVVYGHSALAIFSGLFGIVGLLRLLSRLQDSKLLRQLTSGCAHIEVACVTSGILFNRF